MRSRVSDAANDVRGGHNAIVTKIFGEHNVRMGAGYIGRQFTVFQSASPVGNFTFNTQLTDNGTGAGGNTIASFLLGYPSQVARSHSLIYPHYHTNEPNAFVQDDWRATSWLTLNLGVRYDVFTPLTEEANQLANFDPATGKVLVAGQNGVSDSANVKTDYSNIAPRLGFSATLPSSIVVRGGYGLAYFPGNMQSGAFMKNAPWVSSYGPILSNGTTGGQPTVFLSNGLPTPVPIDPVNPSGAIIAVDQHFKSTRVQQFNVIVEKEFAGNVLGAGFVGSRGTASCRTAGRPVPTSISRQSDLALCSRAVRSRHWRPTSRASTSCSRNTNRRTTRCSWCSSAATTPASRTTR